MSVDGVSQHLVRRVAFIAIDTVVVELVLPRGQMLHAVSATRAYNVDTF